MCKVSPGKDVALAGRGHRWRGEGKVEHSAALGVARCGGQLARRPVRELLNHRPDVFLEAQRNACEGLLRA